MQFGGFKWIETEDFNLQNVKIDSKKGHILEVDLQYPKELHDLHNEYPFCPENILVKSEMLSEYCKVVGDKNSAKCDKLIKLICDENKLEKYISNLLSEVVYYLIKILLVFTTFKKT